MALLSEFNKTWNESFMNYATEIGKVYKEHPENIINCLGFKSVLDCLNETYQVLVKEKEIDPIERLPSDKKNELWLKAKKIGTGKVQCISICKAIYLLDKITE